MPRLVFEKTGNAVWISHLDLMRLFQRAFKRAGLSLKHTQGFNPRPSVSIALPLSVGVESVCELLDFDLLGESATNEEIREYIKTRCPFNHMTVMVKKSAVIEAGNYKDLFWNEDYYLWIRMLLSGSVFGNTGTVLVNVRVGEDMYKRRGGAKYFKSEKYLQDFMRKNKIIGFKTYFMNVLKRFVVQRLLPNRLRGWVFRTFARTGSK